MSGQRQCPSCGRQFEEAYQYCPFDATPLGRRCPTCGKSWDKAFQFCPLDSTPLSAAAPAQEAVPDQIAFPAREKAGVSAAAPVTAKTEPFPAGAPASTAPQPAQRVYVPKPTAFTFAEQAEKPAWKAVLFRPMTILFALGALAVGFAVWYLDWITGGPDLPDRKSTRLNSSHIQKSRMPSSA